MFEAIRKQIGKRTGLPLWAVSILLSVLLSALILAPSAMAKVTSEMVRAQQLKDQGHLRDALQHANSAVMMDPNDVDALYLRGAIYNELDDQRSALKDLDKAIRIRPDYWRAYSLRANTYIDCREYDKAISDLNTAIKLNKKPTGFILADRAQAYNALGKTDLALADLKGAIELATKEKNIDRLRESYMYRGQIYYNSAKYKEAADDLTHAIALGSFKDELYLQRAAAYEKLRQFDQAIADYSKLISVNREDESAYEKRGRLLLASKKFELALADANQAISNYPGENPSRLYRFRAEIYQKMGKLDLAKKDLEKAKDFEAGQL